MSTQTSNKHEKSEWSLSLTHSLLTLAAVRRLVTDFKSYTEKIPDITSKQAATAQVIFRSHRKEIREFCNAVDALLSKTDRLNTDCSVRKSSLHDASVLIPFSVYRNLRRRLGKRVNDGMTIRKRGYLIYRSNMALVR